MPTYHDTRFHGPPDAVAALIASLGDGANVIGPRLLDGVAYACVRADAPLALPAGLTVTGAELSAAVIGVWA